MQRTEPDTDANEPVIDALHRIQAFLAVVLAERSGPLTSLQREFIQSAHTATKHAERRLRAN